MPIESTRVTSSNRQARSPELSLTKAKVCFLFISVSANRVRAAVFDPSNKSYIAACSVTCGRQGISSLSSKDLLESFKGVKWLRNAYQKVVFSVWQPDFELAPASALSGAAYGYSLKGSDAIILTEIPPSVKEFVSRYFPTASLQHGLGAVLESASLLTQGNVLLAKVIDGYLYLVATSKGQPHLANSFKVSCAADVLFFCLQVAQGLEWPADELRVFVVSVGPTDFAFQDDLTPYFSAVTQLPAPAWVDTGMLPDDGLIQELNELLYTPLCV